MNSDAALVARYARTRDAEAFAELFRRYGGLVHGTCLRMTGNLHDAEDLAQGCFMDLARQCETIRDSLPGWLHRVAINRSSELMRGESRRRRREEACARAASSQDDRARMWEQTAPHVDEAVCDLPDELRLPIMFYFLQGKTQAEVSQELGIDRSTVSRRLQKGVDRLRGEMKKAGIIISAGLLAALLERNAAQAAPAGLVAAVGRMAIAGVGTESGASPTLGKAHRGVKHPTAYTWKGLIMKVTAIAAAGAALVLAAVVIAGNRPGAAQPPAPVGPGEPPTIETWPNLPQLALPIADIDAIVGIDKAGESADVRRLLKSNGFAVAPKYYHQIFSPYIQEHLPAFVTCDSLHRTFHVIFEEQLKRLETGMAADVTKVTTLMAQSIRARDNEERHAAASALSAVADERDLPALKNVALNADRRQRRAAINILGKMRAPAVKETLIDLLRHTPHPDTVDVILRVFQRRGSKDVTPHLLDAWPDASRDARSSIIEALATIWQTQGRREDFGNRFPSTLTPDQEEALRIQVGSLVTKALHSSDARVWIDAMQAVPMLRLNDAVPKLEEIANENRGKRDNVIDALSPLKTVEARAALRRLLARHAKDDPNAASRIARHFGQLDDKTAPLLYKLLDDRRNNNMGTRVCDEAIMSLVKVDPDGPRFCRPHRDAEDVVEKLRQAWLTYAAIRGKGGLGKAGPELADRYVEQLMVLIEVRAEKRGYSPLIGVHWVRSASEALAHASPAQARAFAPKVQQALVTETRREVKWILEIFEKYYKRDFGVYPPEAPGHWERAVENKRKRYVSLDHSRLDKQGRFCDAWGNPYRYHNPARHTESPVEIYSVGPNGKDNAGKGDDIVSWEPDETSK